MRTKLTPWLIWAGIFLLGAASASAQYQQIKMTRIGPRVQVNEGDETVRLYSAENGDLVQEDEVVVTVGDGSRVILVFSNGATINIAENSEVVISQFTQDPFAGDYAFGEASREPSASRSQTRIHLSRGELIGNVKSLNEGSSFEVTTPAGAAGIRGTTFRVVFRPTGDGRAFFTVTTIEGDVAVTTITGTTDTPISVTDLEEVEILVEVDDDTGEVTVLTPTSEIVTKTASPETVAQVTQEVQTAAEEVSEVVLKEVADTSTGGDDTGDGDGNDNSDGNDNDDGNDGNSGNNNNNDDGDSNQQNQQEKQEQSTTPQNQTDDLSPTQGGGTGG